MPHVVVQDPGGISVAQGIGPGARLGRDAACEVVLADAKVSRHHATIERAADGWYVVDAGSRHGTSCNGVPVARARLADGDRLTLGKTVVVFGVGEVVSEVIARHGAEDAPAGGVAARVGALHGLAEAARAIGDRDAVLLRALAGAIEAVRAERGLIAMHAMGGTWRRVAEVRGAEIVVSRAVLDAVARGEALLARERGVAGTTDVRAVMTAPIESAGEVAGFVYVERGARDAFGADDLAVLAAFATATGAIADAAARIERAEARAAAAALAAPPAILLGASAAAEALRRDVERLAAVDLAVHVTGEPGAGKGLVARALHAASRRAGAPLVAIDCAALDDASLDRVLFGEVADARTAHRGGGGLADDGTRAAHRGHIALADGGTLFLDEVAALSPAAQAAIVRVLEDGEVVPVGAARGVRVDVRVLSASHRDLRAEVAAGRFREDLFYRLVVAELHVPPLRARGGDVAILAAHVLAAARVRGARTTELSPDAAAALAAYAWPGNVRELRNVVERAAALASGPRIEVDDLRLLPGPRPATAAALPSLAERFAALDATERDLVDEAMAKARGNVAEAARLLGITRIMMKRRLDRYAGGPDAPPPIARRA